MIFDDFECANKACSPLLLVTVCSKFTLNQDPMNEMLLQLSFVQLVYNIGNYLEGMYFTGTPAALTARARGGGEASSSHLSAMTESEFFVMVMMLIIPLHK